MIIDFILMILNFVSSEFVPTGSSAPVAVGHRQGWRSQTDRANPTGQKGVRLFGL
jgi:hypothetical protein